MSEYGATMSTPSSVLGGADSADSAIAEEKVVGEDVIFTESAAQRVRELIEEEKNDSLMLRVFISGGGCSGFQYGFMFDDEREADDVVLEKSNVMVLIDPMSYQYLTGSEIDYRNDLNGSQFVIRNPNVTSTCGCGSSFSV